MRRDVFMRYKFRGNYAEDLDLGFRLIQDGHKMAFLSSTRIIHSHKRPASYYLKRLYVDTVFMLQRFPDYEIPIAEADALMRETVFVYKSISELLRDGLRPSVKSCSVSELSTAVMKGLTRSAAVPHEITIENNGYVDEFFQSFVFRVFERYSLDDSANCRGALMASLRSFLLSMLAYMHQIYDILDESILIDFRQSLFKAFALVCGVHFAASLARGSAHTTDVLQQLCIDLDDGI
jgi:hypothetical protein